MTIANKQRFYGNPNISQKKLCILLDPGNLADDRVHSLKFQANDATKPRTENWPDRPSLSKIEIMNRLTFRLSYL